MDSTPKKDDISYPQVYVKECKYIEKKVIGHKNENLSGFSNSSDESEEE